MAAFFGPKKLLKFEIRPEVDFIVFRGSAGNTPDYVLKGHVVLMNGEKFRTNGPMMIDLVGKRQTMYRYRTFKEETLGPPGGPFLTRARFYDRTYPLSERSLVHNCDGQLETQEPHGTTFPPGNHEFPFEFVLPGDLVESVEGLERSGTYVSYDLRAVAPTGKFPTSKSLEAHKHLRIIRTLGDDTEQVLDPHTIAGFWPDKLKYSFNTFSKLAPHGTCIKCTARMMPMLEKLKIGTINISLKEIRKIRTANVGPDKVDGQWQGMWKQEEIVARHSVEVPPNCEEVDEEWQLPSYRFDMCLPLPKSLNECRQTIEDGEWIEITHKIYYEVLLHNPDGHVSELKTFHPVKLFISPRLLGGDSNQVALDGAQEQPQHREGPDLLGEMQAPPPLYEKHHLDILYSDIDPDGFMTPVGRSGLTTPFACSRGTSHEDLAALAASSHSAASPHQLASRLESVEAGNDEQRLSTRLSRRHLLVNGHSPNFECAAAPLAGNDSDQSFEQDGTPEHNTGDNQEVGEMPNGVVCVEYDMQALERITSYNTAIKTPVHTSWDSVPPRYERPSSRRTTTSPGLEVPGQVHIRNGYNSPSMTRR